MDIKEDDNWMNRDKIKYPVQCSCCRGLIFKTNLDLISREIKTGYVSYYCTECNKDNFGWGVPRKNYEY